MSKNLVMLLYVLLFVASMVLNWLLVQDRDAWRQTAYRATDALEVCVYQYQDANDLNQDLLRVLRPPPPVPPNRREFLMETADE